MTEGLIAIATNPESWKLVAQAMWTVVALAALCLAIRNERRNQLRFQQQLDLSKRVVEANVRPFLGVTTLTYENHRGLELSNHGVGTAVIRNVTFQRGTRTATNAAELLQLKRGLAWDDFTDYESGPFYLPSKETETLVELTLEGLIHRGIPKIEALDLMCQLETQLKEIDVLVTYEDVLGNVIAKNQILQLNTSDEEQSGGPPVLISTRKSTSDIRR